MLSFDEIVRIRKVPKTVLFSVFVIFLGSDQWDLSDGKVADGTSRGVVGTGWHLQGGQEGKGRMGADRRIKWMRLSSKTGDLPIPPGSDQQTLCLVLDADRDGRNEFIIGCRGKGPALAWFRPGANGWSVFLIEDQSIPIEAGGAFCDIDGDGDLDIVAGEDYQGNKVYWWENPYPHYDPTVPWKRHLIKADGARQHHDQIFGDFDGDGRPELVFWNQGAEQLFLAKIPPDPKAGPWVYEPIFAGAGEGLAAGDIDGDGIAEVIAGGFWFQHKGNGQFIPHPIDPQQTHPRIAVGDLNEDGQLEVVMVPGDGVGRLKWYHHKGDPTGEWISYDLLGFDVEHGHSLAVADFDGDGHLDIFCAEMRKWTAADDNPDAKMWLFFGDGNGHFTKTEIASGCDLHEAKVADVDSDGRPDIIAKPYNWDTPRIDLWLNRGE
ncbi:MAG: VCBS repeat-containing protein [Armatimonadetes bacterium]|nr:VCBS repeat-containing protein [Armatimonadota bacterium]MDW8121059.1 VCBS repeat-containing protein [Armatimonadota bacterium]